jgi:hypothetical protein
MLNHLHTLTFGDWRKESTAVVGEFTKPGYYVMSAQAHGLKGWIGGRHSYIVHVPQTGQHDVYEITDYETLTYQDVWDYTAFKPHARYNEAALFKVARHGFQQWFGAFPRIESYTEAWPTEQDLDELCEHYPHKNDEFSLLNVNCNTFVSWCVYSARQHNVQLHFPKTYGTKSDAYWKNFYA